MPHFVRRFPRAALLMGAVVTASAVALITATAQDVPPAAKIDPPLRGALRSGQTCPA